MRTESKAMKFIKVQCNILDLNPKALYEQSKTLLLFYQHVIWAVKSRAVDLRKEITGTYGMELHTACAAQLIAVNKGMMVADLHIDRHVGVVHIDF